MDLSKLPKLSESPAPAPPPPDADQPIAAAPSAPPNREEIGTMIGAEVWISLIIGLIFVMLGFNFAKYSFALLTGRQYHTHVDWQSGPKAGNEVAYAELEGDAIWNDSALFVF